MKHTPALLSHIKQGAKMIPFAGWNMPFRYSNPSTEHLHVRSHGGVFDVSHMGEIRIQGPESLVFLEWLVPSDIRSLKPGHCQYSVFCNEEGGLIDDLIIYCLQFEKEYFLCVNASCKDKDLSWLKSHQADFKIEIKDESEKWAMTAIQGPKAMSLCKSLFPDMDFSVLKRFQFVLDKTKSYLFSATGYTGEEGLEIYSPWEDFSDFWSQILEQAKNFSILPIGLGARDTLRLEMAYLLSGQDFDETQSPMEAGLKWILNNPKNHIAKKALLKKQTYKTKLRGFIMEEALAVPRKGFPVLSSKGEKIGLVTSGAKSPSLEKMIGLAYIQKGVEEAYLDIRGSKAKINIVQTPFLKK